VNEPRPIRILVNTPEPDQRGMVVPVGGKLVDILPDPLRDRFFVLRQDTNQVLVFDGQSYAQIAALQTGNTPTQMAITFDRRLLLVGHDGSQYLAVYDLETLEPGMPIRTPGSLSAFGRLLRQRSSRPTAWRDRYTPSTGWTWQPALPSSCQPGRVRERR
jgi:hypothetical protein